MTNEEKILELLGQMRADMTAMKTDMTAMKERLDVIDERSQRTAVMLEADVLPRLQSLYEGHQAIMDAITPKEQIEEMAADISVLRMASRTHSKEIAELKKAR